MPQVFMIPFLVYFVSFMCIWSKPLAQHADTLEASIMLTPSSTQTRFLKTEKMLSLLIGLEVPTDNWGKPLRIHILTEDGETLFQRQLSWEESLYGGEGITLNLKKRRLSVKMGEISLSQVGHLTLEICQASKPSGTYECIRQ